MINFTDVSRNKSFTLPYAHRRNISRIALDDRGNLLLSIDEDGQAILASFPRRLVLSHFSFHNIVTTVAFSPSGLFFAVGLGRNVQVWHTPSSPNSASDDGLEFAPFVLQREYFGHHDIVQSIDWSRDSSFILSASKDLTARVWSLRPDQKIAPTSLSGHRESLLGAWFLNDREEVSLSIVYGLAINDKCGQIYTVSQDGALFHWRYSRESIGLNDVNGNGDTNLDLQWKIIQRLYFMQTNARVRCVTYHAKTKLLVVGFSDGLFSLYELPDFNMIHTLRSISRPCFGDYHSLHLNSISQNDIDCVNMNKSGEWLAFATSRFGQLLVWEWQSECYILKQQGHSDSMNALTYSPDGRSIITAADDGKIKVWDAQSSFCVVTFTEHSSGVTACEFAKKGNVLFTSSLDGSIRAWDLLRYRNFRTFTAPTRLSFSSMAIDPSGEVICAASLDSFEIHIWSVQTGQLLDRLAGHEGPIASLAFAPTGGIIVSGSWDQTVRVWSVFGRRQTSEALQLQADVLQIAVRSDSKQVAISTLDGQLTFWSLVDASQETILDGSRDVSGGRKLTDRRIAANAPGTQSFSCIAYSTNGACIIAGGRSKYICLYDVQSGVMVKKFVVSLNLSLDGTQEFLNSRNLIEGGAAGLIDDQGEEPELEGRIDRTMPGARRGDMSRRQRAPEVRVSALAFSPTGRAFCAASTEGLLIYSLDDMIQFDPFDLDLSITPKSALKCFAESDYLQALVIAFRLNENTLTRSIYEKIPMPNVAYVTKYLPPLYLTQLLRLIAQASDERPHIELNLRWLEILLKEHGQYIKANTAIFSTDMRTILKAVEKVQTDFTLMNNSNTYALEFLLSQPVKEIHATRDQDF